jgi:DNA-directed RNA polymerase beta' subunit
VQLDIISIDKFIEVNECPEVTNPIFFDSGNIPTDDGLFSYKLFGVPASYDRKTIFGYIDLHSHFMHPLIYKMLSVMDSRIKYIIEGSKYYKIVGKGDLEEDSENGETGLDFLYKNFKNIKFKSTSSNIRQDKIDVINSLSIDEIFVSKWLVIPAYFRDPNFSKAQYGKLSVDIINNLYARLLNLSSSIKSDTMGFEFAGNITKNNIQQILVEIYDSLISGLSKKKGYIQQHLLGKAVDYAVRSVISAPRINSETWDKQKIEYTHTGIPLALACVLFYPYFVAEIKEFLTEELDQIKYIEDAKGNKLKLINPMNRYTPDEISKYINLFIKSPTERFSKMVVDTEKGVRSLLLYRDDLGRDFTLTDLLFLMAHRICKDKHVYVTRYPIEHHQNIYPSRIKILSTYKTKVQKIGNKVFEDYPDIYLEYPCEESLFIDTSLLNNSYLKALGGDYDGDMVSIRGVYSQEANIEAEEIINSARNLLDGSGKLIRKIGNEAVLTLYTLTKD